MFGRLFGVEAGTAFFVTDPVVQYLPDDAAKLVGYCPDRLEMTEVCYLAAIVQFKHAVLGFDGSVGTLSQ